MANSLGPERLRKEHHEYEVVQADVQCLGHGVVFTGSGRDWQAIYHYQSLRTAGFRHLRWSCGRRFHHGFVCVVFSRFAIAVERLDEFFTNARFEVKRVYKILLSNADFLILPLNLRRSRWAIDHPAHDFYIIAIINLLRRLSWRYLAVLLLHNFRKAQSLNDSLNSLDGAFIKMHPPQISFHARPE
jgi:hypothetical protein